MAKDYGSLVSQTQKDVLLIEQELQTAKETRDELSRELRNARARLDTKRNGTGYPNRLVNKIIKDLKQGNELPFQLIRRIDNAIENQANTEFDKEVYKRALYAAAKNKDIYKFVKSGAGWSTKVSVEIVYEESAGTLMDWAKGITAYRRKLKTRIGTEGSDRGLKATSWWLSNVHGTALENSTVTGRIESSGRLAPFWRILNNGSVSLPSDRPDNTYNPFPVQPSNFIDDAERSCETLFLAEFLPEEQRWLQETEEFAQVVNDLQESRDAMSRQVQQIRLDAKLNRKIFDSFHEKKQYIDQNKLAEFVRRYRAGEEFERSTIELTAKGSPVRVRPTVKSLILKVEGYDF